MSDYDVGDVIRLSAAFTDINGTPATPTAITLFVKKPDGSVLEQAIDPDTTVVYDLSIDQAGWYVYRWESTGTVQTAEEGSFLARPSRVTS